MAIDSGGGAGHRLPDGAQNRIRTDAEVAVAAAVDAATAAGGGGDVVDASGDDQSDRLRPAFGAGELRAAFLDVGGDNVAIGIWFVFGDEHGHVNGGRGLRAEMDRQFVLAGAVAVMEG